MPPPLGAEIPSCTQLVYWAVLRRSSDWFVSSCELVVSTTALLLPPLWATRMGPRSNSGKCPPSCKHPTNNVLSRCPLVPLCSTNAVVVSAMAPPLLPLHAASVTATAIHFTTLKLLVVELRGPGASLALPAPCPSLFSVVGVFFGLAAAASAAQCVSEATLVEFGEFGQ